MSMKTFDVDSTLSSIVGDYLTYTKDDVMIVIRSIKRGEWDKSYINIIPDDRVDEIFGIALTRKNDEAVDGLFPYITDRMNRALFFAYKGDEKELIHMYKDSKDDKNFRECILGVACRYGCLDIVQRYFHDEETTPLIGLEEAAEGGHTDLTTYLLLKGFSQYYSAAVAAIRGGHLSLGMMFYEKICTTMSKQKLIGLTLSSMMEVSPMHDLSDTFLEMGLACTSTFLYNLVDYDRFDKIEDYAKNGQIKLYDVIIAILSNSDYFGVDYDAISRIIEIGKRNDLKINYGKIVGFVEGEQIVDEEDLDFERANTFVDNVQIFKNFLEDKHKIEL